LAQALPLPLSANCPTGLIRQPRRIDLALASDRAQY
jgi:hypothetical protein